jgi:hypothetical protein
MSEARVCPFCGEPPEVNRASNNGAWWIVSCECAACPTIEAEGKANALALWNIRAPAKEPHPESLRELASIIWPRTR